MIDGFSTFTSRLNFTFGEDVSVERLGNIRSVGTATLQTPGEVGGHVMVKLSELHGNVQVLLPLLSTYSTP